MQAFKVKFGQRLISAWGNSPMGYSVAAGIGGKIHNKNNWTTIVKNLYCASYNITTTGAAPLGLERAALVWCTESVEKCP